MVNIEERVIDGVVLGQIHNGVLRLRKCLPNLVGPPLPRVAAPEIVGPEKPAFQEIDPQLRCLLFAEVRASRLCHHDERTLEELRVCETDNDMSGIAFYVQGHRRLGHLGQPEG